jgi:hypothetical protein
VLIANLSGEGSGSMKGFTPFSRVKGFAITAKMQLRAQFSTGFHDHEGFATLFGIKSFMIMAGTSARCGWYSRGCADGAGGAREAKSFAELDH